jgi:hypothetical protein
MCYQIDCQLALHIKATLDNNFKKIAVQNSIHPAKLYNMLLASQKK